RSGARAGPPCALRLWAPAWLRLRARRHGMGMGVTLRGSAGESIHAIYPLAQPARRGLRPQAPFPPILARQQSRPARPPAAETRLLLPVLGTHAFDRVSERHVRCERGQAEGVMQRILGSLGCEFGLTRTWFTMKYLAPLQRRGLGVYNEVMEV